MNIAIDGPAGAGKSTAAKAAAKRFGIIYVDTGALYRATGLYMLRCGADPGDPDEVLPLLNEVHITLRFEDGAQHIYLNGEDVSTEIRLPEASSASSAVSAIPEVREFLLDLQRDIAKKNDCIMDGRDIGTVVLPDAQVKIFVTATAEIRAKRRYDEYIGKGMEADYDEILEAIKQRDYNDSHRAVAPLRQADDAVYLDTTEMNAEQEADAVCDIILARFPERMQWT